MSRKYAKRAADRAIGGMKKRDDAQTSFEAVKTMMMHPKAQVSALSYNSMSGFLFRLDIPHDKTCTPPFVGLNAEGTAFTRPVYSLVLKLAMVVPSFLEQTYYFKHNPLRDNKRNSLFVVDKFYRKHVEVLQDFIEEADIQQYIYIKTLSPAGKPLCLAVVDMAYFDDNKTSQQFISTLLLSSLRQDDVAAAAMLEFLQRKLAENPYVALGMISMELADGFVPLYQLSRPPLTDAHAHAHAKACEQSLAQLIVLFLNFKIVHWDCHSNNVMATETGEKACLIDFGRVLDLHRMSDHISDNISRLYLEMQHPLTPTTDFVQQLDELKTWRALDLWEDAKTTGVVLDKLHAILLFLARVDVACNQMNLPHNNIATPQCFHLLKYIYGNQIRWFAGRPIHAEDKEIWQTRLARVIPWIKTLTAVPTERANNQLSAKAVRKLVLQKRIFTIGHDIQLYNQKLMPARVPSQAIFKKSESRTTEDHSSSDETIQLCPTCKPISITSSRRKQSKSSAVKKASSSQRTRKTTQPQIFKARAPEQVVPTFQQD